MTDQQHPQQQQQQQQVKDGQQLSAIQGVLQTMLTRFERHFKEIRAELESQRQKQTTMNQRLKAIEKFMSKDKQQQHHQHQHQSIPSTSATSHDDLISVHRGGNSDEMRMTFEESIIEMNHNEPNQPVCNNNSGHVYQVQLVSSDFRGPHWEHSRRLPTDRPTDAMVQSTAHSGADVQQQGQSVEGPPLWSFLYNNDNKSLTTPTTRFVPTKDQQDQKQNNLGQFRCIHCDRVYFKEKDLVLHARFHTNKYRYICNFCGKAFAAYSNLEKHRYIHKPKRYSCIQCGKKFIFPSLLSKHVRKCHSSEESANETRSMFESLTNATATHSLLKN